MDTDSQSTSEKVCLYVGLAAVAIPGLIIAGFMRNWGELPVSAWVAISMFGGALGAAGCTQPRWMAGIAGLVGGACIPLAMVLYTILRLKLSDTFARIEFLIPGFLGALPAIGLFYLLKRFFGEAGQG